MKTRLFALASRMIKLALPQTLFVEYWGTALDAAPTKLSSQDANFKIANLLKSNSPCLIGRLGSTELYTLYQIERCKNASFLPKIYEVFRSGRYNIWDARNWSCLSFNSGFFPIDRRSLDCFHSEMLRAVNDLDVIGSWLKGESRYTAKMDKLIAVKLRDLEPYFHRNPWSTELAEKKVLVIHPFARIIASQYQKNRPFIFKDPNVLPSFELSVLPAVQTIGEQSDSRFANWFEALEWMEDQAMRMNFDVALVGCGAYGLPLAARLKRHGKKAIHLGGALQVLFGIKGARWDSRPEFRKFYNSSWIRPGKDLRPSGYQLVEAGCYW